MIQDSLVIAGKTYTSRLLVGTGKYKDETEAIASIEASGAEIVTVAVRRIDLQNDKDSSILDYISPDKYTILPNTAGAYTTKDAVRMAKLGREILSGKNLLKLEVLEDPKTLLPNMDSTIEAAEILVRDGFEKKHIDMGNVLQSLYVNRSIYLSIYLSISIDRSIYPSISLSLYASFSPPS